MANGLLLVAFDYTNAHEDEFHDWYDFEHLPERQATLGFGRCERWIDVETPKRAVASYDLSAINVMNSPAYKAIAYDNLTVWSKRVVGMCDRVLRFEGSQSLPGDLAAPAGAGGLLLNAMNVAPEAEADFNAWYDEEHIPALASVPGTVAARRYVAAGDSANTHKYVALYHLESPDVTRTEAWAKAVDTPWSARIRPHFRDRIRLLAGAYSRKP